MGLLTFQIPSAVFLLTWVVEFFSSFFWRVAAIFAGLALFTGIHGYKPRLYAFSPAQSGCQQSGATWTHCAGCYQPLIFSNSVPLFWNGAKVYLCALPTFDFSNSVSALFLELFNHCQILYNTRPQINNAMYKCANVHIALQYLTVDLSTWHGGLAPGNNRFAPKIS